jgi:glycosyltransferase involved in cell wall biosynthesis
MLSTVIPVYNEAESLAELHAELDKVAREQDYDLEIVFVDDGSTDDSWRTIQDLARQDARVRGIRFRRNFGKAAALSAGFDAARGEIVLTLDADLQDDPQEIPRFLEAMGRDLDVVSGWKKVRHDPWHKVYPSRVFNWLVGALTKVRLHDHNCGFKCYRREIFQEVRLYGELHRFVPVLAAARGWKVGEVEVNHRPRKHGSSKYGMRRFMKGFLDLLTVYFLTGFEQRPQHLLGTIGILSFLFGLLGLAYLAVYWVIKNSLGMEEWPELHERPAMIYSMGALLLGAQFMSIGFLAELMTAYYGRTTVMYSIKDRTGGEPEDPAKLDAGGAPSPAGGDFPNEPNDTDDGDAPTADGDSSSNMEEANDHHDAREPSSSTTTS